MFKAKEEVYTVKEFMALKTDDKAVKKGVKYNGVLLPLAFAPILGATPAFAQSNDALYDTMLHAFDPLITLVKVVAYPIATVVVLGGALFIMIGNKEKGFAMMQSAGLGYVLVQLTPLFLKVMVDAMKGVV